MQENGGDNTDTIFPKRTSDPECLTCDLTYYMNETESEISLFLRKHTSVTGTIKYIPLPKINSDIHGPVIYY